ncbi:hypothetical protein TanjilG_07567 [Lupinus angustifolius]|nr:hypothetical protein TanjilG_02487 [Lupinus angustifolius]OIW21663.1 hypothetical protein TanjilG_07567 [Lupinus angustifolius]
MKESPKLSNNNSVNQNRPRRSRSTGFRFTNLLPRSHSLVQRGENLERFTLRLPEEVRNQLVTSTLSRTKSLGVAFTPESSERRGYRTRSVGSGCGRNNLERLDQSDRRMFRWMSRAGSNISKKVTEFNKDDVGERSSDRLFSGKENDM